MKSFHLGPWESEIGYSQSIRIGNRILVSGTVASEPLSKNFETQLREIYDTIVDTLAHNGATLKNVIKENIYCRDIEELINCQEIRKIYYEGHMPVSTWVQVERLYMKEHLLEIEIEAVVE